MFKQFFLFLITYVVVITCYANSDQPAVNETDQINWYNAVQDYEQAIESARLAKLRDQNCKPEQCDKNRKMHAEKQQIIMSAWKRLKVAEQRLYSQIATVEKAVAENRRNDAEH